MSFDKEIYKALYDAKGENQKLMKVTLYCTTKSENPSPFYRAQQIIDYALSLQGDTFKVHHGEFQEPRINEKGDVFGHATYTLHNLLDIDRLLGRR